MCSSKKTIIYSTKNLTLASIDDKEYFCPLIMI